MNLDCTEMADVERDLREALRTLTKALGPLLDDGNEVDTALCQVMTFCLSMLPQVQEQARVHRELRRLVDYDPETGVFRWKQQAGRANAGDVAGCLRGDGYINMIVNGRRGLAHRFAWFYVHGQWPADMIDHRNGQRSDNRIENLREADNTLNSQNMRAAKPSNATGFLGVSRGKDGLFNAQIGVNGKTHWLGKFATPEEAHETYLKAKRLLHAGCTI